MSGTKIFLSAVFKKDKIHPDNVHFYSVLNAGSIIGLLGHSVFLIIFIFLGMPVLLAVNTGSIILYLACFIINRRGRHLTAFLVGIGEIVIHAFAAVYFLGWESGFHYYVLSILPMVFFFSRKGRAFRASVTFFLMLVYAGIFIYSINFRPVLNSDLAVENDLNIMNMVATAGIIALISFYYSRTVIKAENKLKRMNRDLGRLARIDYLTKISNRRAILEKIKDEVKLFKRTKRPFSLVISDIDDFKRFNDLYGHDCGDHILKCISDVMKRSLRSHDSLARWGGEEFMMLLPETFPEDALSIAERLRKRIQNTKFIYGLGKYELTMTFGIGVYNGVRNSGDIIIIADMALLEGKKKGKNCVVFKPEKIG